MSKSNSDELLVNLWSKLDDHFDTALLSDEDVEEIDELIEAEYSKREQALLDRLDKSMPTPEQLITKYGYYMPEKQYGYKLGLHDIREVIEAERAKLKEVK